MHERAEYILGTTISIEFIKEKLLKKHNKTDKKASPTKNSTAPSLQSYSAETISQEHGFASHIIKINLHWSENISTLPRSIVIKTPTDSKFSDLKDEVLPDAPEISAGEAIPVTHQTECSFYSLWNKSNPPPLTFEDLSDKLAQQKVGDGLTVPQLMQIAEELAGLHSWCLTHKGWAEKFPGVPKDVMESFSKSFIPMYDSVVKDYPQHFNTKKIEAIKKHCESFEDLWYLNSLHEELKMPPVLVHGDLWAGNIMFTKTTDKQGKSMPSDQLLAIFDWQASQPGCASIDFARLACTSLSVEVRREKMKAVMQHYHATLKHKLGKEPPYSFETLLKGYFKSMKAQTNTCFWFILLLKTRKETLGGAQYEEEILKRFVALLDDTLSILEPDMIF